MFGKKAKAKKQKEIEMQELVEIQVEKKQGEELFRKYKSNTILISLIMIFVGILLVIFPGTIRHIIGYIIGTVTIIMGIVYIAKYFKKDEQQFDFGHELVIGVTLVILGILTYINVNLIAGFFQPLLGFFVLITGVEKLQTAIDLVRMKKEKGSEKWKVILILSIINIVFGIVLLLIPSSLVTLSFILIGVALIYSGVASLFASHFFQKCHKNSMKKEI